MQIVPLNFNAKRHYLYGSGTILHVISCISMRRPISFCHFAVILNFFFFEKKKLKKY
jgi:hypothetical protein